MKRSLKALAILWVLFQPLAAKEIPHYRMDSFAYLSDEVVLCEEKKIDFVETKYHGGLKTVHCVIACKIIETFKGGLKAGADIELKYDASFARYRFGQGGYMDTSTDPPTLVNPKYAPTGRAVVFLKKDKDAGYRVVTAKLIQGSDVLQFRQFDNPGPLVLTQQNPERVKLTQHIYSEVDFLKDVRLSVEASRALQSPVRITWDDEQTLRSHETDGQQGGADQPATRSELKPEGGDKTRSEPESRPR